MRRLLTVFLALAVSSVFVPMLEGGDGIATAAPTSGGPPDVARPQKRERQKGRRPNVAIEASRRGQRDDCLKRSIEFEQTLAHELQALEMRIDCYANTA